MRDLLAHMPRPDYALAMAPTEDSLRAFREFLPESCIFDHFSQDKLERVMSLQRELVNRGKKRSILIILDDCLYQKGVLKSTAMRSLFFNGRHLNVGLICAAQYMMDVGPELRTNIDYLFTMRENTINNRKKLHTYFFGQFGRFEEFDKVMTACTQNYSALCMDATVSSTHACDTIFWYRANTHVPEFKLVSPVYWSLSRTCGRSNEEVRSAQIRQFEIETAQSKNTTAGTGKITVVQTEDEHGNIISSTN